METLILILNIALACAGIGIVTLVNIFIWGGIVAVIRGIKNGNDKNVHKH